MKPEQKVLINTISEIWDKYPSLRFGQLLFNLNILEFTNPNSESNSYLLRDSYNDSEQSLYKRIQDSSLYRQIYTE